MPRARAKSQQVPRPARDPWVRALLSEIPQTSLPATARALDRLAVAYVVPSSPDALPAGPVPPAEVRVVALHRRVVEDRGLRPVALYATYRVALDLAPGPDGIAVGTGMMHLECESVRNLADRTGAGLDDLGPGEARLAAALWQGLADTPNADLAPGLRLPPFAWSFDAPPDAEPGVDLDAFAAEAFQVGPYPAWPARCFIRRPDARFEAHPRDGSPDPWAAGLAAPDATAHGSWCLRDGVAYPNPPAPRAVHAFLDEFRGRSVRNPAYQVLRAVGLAPLDRSFAAWRGGLVRHDGSREYQEARYEAGPLGPAPANAAARLREAIAAAATADDGATGRLFAMLRAACVGLGVPAPADDDAAAALLDAAARPAAVPDAPAIQVVRLPGLPAPETMRFVGDELVADLYDLGAAGAAFEQVPEPRIARGPARDPRRAGRPAERARWRPAAIA